MVTAKLGKPINIRKTDLLGYFQESEASVFEPLPETCFIKKKIGYTGSIFDYYANIQAFYTKVAVGAGLDASLESSFSVGFYPQQCREEVDSRESTVSGVSLNIRALTEKILVKKDCLVETAKLTQYFVNDFELLPVKFEKPWLRNSWRDYDIF